MVTFNGFLKEDPAEDFANSGFVSLRLEDVGELTEWRPLGGVLLCVMVIYSGFTPKNP